jgi:tRNA-2-methylthio-N6-dimethylallyladenosine synthase
MPLFSIITYGCQMNQHDSARMAEVLRQHGYEEVSEVGAADVVLVNTCSVRDKAEQKLMSDLGRLAKLKRRRRDLALVVAGCVAQQHAERLRVRAPHVDLIVGPDHLHELGQLLAGVRGGGAPQVRTQFDVDHPRFLQARPDLGAATPSAYVTITKGCSEHCSFCIVPYTRGPERHRPSQEIIGEVSNLVAAGTREVTLLGQTVNRYDDPHGSLPAGDEGEREDWRHTDPVSARRNGSRFPELVRAIARRVPGLCRLRYTSPHPRYLTRALIRTHRDLPVLVKHVHLPVQSGSDRVLKRMIRRHTAAEFLERVDALREAVPGLTLSTDVIVGFPGETRQDFEQTLALVDQVGVTGLFGFKYSPRPNTVAQRLGDDVPENEKADRLEELFRLSEALRRAHLQSLVGTTQRVLVEGVGSDGRPTGRTERNEIVHLETQQNLDGTIVEVTVTRAFKNSLEGSLRHHDAPPAPKASRHSLPVVPG